MTVPAIAPTKVRSRPAARGQRAPVERGPSAPRVAVALVGSAQELRGEAASALNRALLRTGRPLVVAATGAPSEVAELGSTLAGALVVPAPAGMSPAELRGIAAAACDADVVRFAHDRRGPAWREAVTQLAEDPASAPVASIIVPSRASEPLLRRTLEAAARAAAPLEAELIVVVDGSGGDAEASAAEFADAVVRLPGRARGPAYARNRGAEIAHADLAVFLDADVVASPEVIDALISTLQARPELAAVFGSFDDGPEDAGFVSRYRSLLAHELHSCMAGEVDIFWASCGAVRLEAFDAVGGFDEWRFPEAEVESVELGHRLRRAGHRILLRPDLQVTHLHPFTLASLILGDLRRLVVPWYRVAVDGGLPRVDFPVRIEKRASLLVLLGAMALVAALFGLGPVPLWWGLAIGGPTIAVLMRWRLYGFMAARAGWAFTLACIPLHQVHAAALAAAALFGRVLGSLFGEPRPDAITEAFAEVGVQRWPPLPRRPQPAQAPAPRA